MPLEKLSLAFSAQLDSACAARHFIKHGQFPRQNAQQTQRLLSPSPPIQAAREVERGHGRGWCLAPHGRQPRFGFLPRTPPHGNCAEGRLHVGQRMTLRFERRKQRMGFVQVAAIQADVCEGRDRSDMERVPREDAATGRFRDFGFATGEGLFREIVEHLRVLGTRSGFLAGECKVEARFLRTTLRRHLVAVVVNDDIGVAYASAQFEDTGGDIFVDRLAIFDATMIAEKTQKSDGQIAREAPAVGRIWGRGHPAPGTGVVAVVRQDQFHRVRFVIGIYDCAQPGRVRGIEHFVGVHVEQPVAGGPGDARVAGLGEIVLPGDVEHFCALALRDLDCVVRGTRIADHDFVGDGRDAGQALGEDGRFVFHDQDYTERRHRILLEGVTYKPSEEAAGTGCRPDISKWSRKLGAPTSLSAIHRRWIGDYYTRMRRILANLKAFQWPWREYTAQFMHATHAPSVHDAGRDAGAPSLHVFFGVQRHPRAASANRTFLASSVT